MATFRYAVLRMNTEWKIVCERRHIGHFATSEAAVETLRKLAAVAGAEGHTVELLLQGPAGELHPIPLARLSQVDFDLADIGESRTADTWPADSVERRAAS
jgi:hypothetical protein